MKIKRISPGLKTFSLDNLKKEERPLLELLPPLERLNHPFEHPPQHSRYYYSGWLVPFSDGWPVFVIARLMLRAVCEASAESSVSVAWRLDEIRDLRLRRRHSGAR